MNETVQVLTRAFTLLELLGNADHHLGVSELARLSSLPLGTTHRLLNTLLALQYVEQDPDTRKYTLGLRILQLRGAVIEQLDLAIKAMPIMKVLMQQVNETVHLAVLNDGQVVYIERVEGTQTHGMYTRLGKRAYAHCTALGKVMLAYSPEACWRSVVAQHGLPRLSPTTITTPDALQAELAQTRQRGYGIDNGETGEMVRCFAAPILDHRGELLAALSVSGPQERIPLSREAELSQAVRWAAGLISQKLGYAEAFIRKERRALR
jgi:DNA-binding IclR family transcriptional regulator